MPYVPPIDIDDFYSRADITHLTATLERWQRWSVHLIGPDKILTHVNPELPDDDPANEEFTQRTALKFAMERNAWAEKANDGIQTVHCVVLHDGDPWVPDASDGPATEYCEYFDFDSYDWFCNQCYEVLKAPGAHCLTCAPTHFPGLMRVPCDAEPNTHPAIFMYADNTDGYSGAFCQFCIAAHQREMDERDAERRHAKHLAWRRWSLTHRALRLGKRLRLVKHYSYSYSAICNGCVRGITWRWSR